MNFFILTSVLFTGLFGLAGQTHAAEAPLTASETALVRLADELDPLAGKKQRATLDGGYRTPLGLQFHPGCFKYAATAGVPRELAEERFRALSFGALQTLAQDCTGRFPDFKPYAREWVAQFRRTIIACSDKNSGELEFGAANLLQGSGLSKYLKPEDRKGLDVTGLFGWGALNRAYKTIVVYPSDTLASAVSAWGPKNPVLQDILIHEILHSTHANNRHDHNEVETTAPFANKRGKCSPDVSFDRVNVIADLCTNTGLGSSTRAAADSLFEQMNQCGGAMCQRLFAGQAASDDLADLDQNWYTPTRGLEKDAAERICAKIYEQGSCRYFLRTQGESLTRGAIAPLNELATRLRERMFALFPHSPVQLSAEILAIMPAMQRELSELENTDCFKAIFDKTPFGALYIKGAAMTEVPNPTPETRANSTLLAIFTRINNVSACNGRPGFDLRWIVQNLSYVTQGSFQASSYKKLLEPRLLHQAEADFEPSPWDTSRTEALRKLVGPELFDEYLAALKKYHWKSPDFDCSTANLAPLHGVEGFRKIRDYKK